MLNLLKKILKKIKYSRSLSDPENYWCGHQQPYNFFPTSRHFPINQENKNQLIQSRKISCNWEKIFFCIISRGKIFTADQKKILISLITCEPVHVYSTMSIALFWWLRRLYISSSFFYFSLLLIMRSQPASIAWTVTFTAAFYHCWNTQDILIYESDVFYIFYINIVCLYEICEFI